MNISIITPCKNPGDLLDLTANSVWQQADSLPQNALEYVIVDGQSTDGTVEKLQKWQQEKGIIFRSEKDRNMTEAMNKAIRLASGDIIGQVNAGDVYLPDVLQYVREQFINRSYDICFCAGIALHTDLDIEILHIPLFMKSELGMTIFNCQTYSCSVFYTRRLCEELGGFDETYRYAQDFDFYAKAMRKKKCIGIEKIATSKYFVQSDQIGIKFNKEQKEEGTRSIAYPTLYKAFRKLPMGVFLHLTGGMKFHSWNDVLYYYRNKLAIT